MRFRLAAWLLGCLAVWVCRLRLGRLALLAWAVRNKPAQLILNNHHLTATQQGPPALSC